MKKTTPNGREYEIEGGRFLIWTSEPDWDTEEVQVIRIPLRIKLRILQVAGNELDAPGMLRMLGLLIPDQEEKLLELDVNDFQEMFKAWQVEYNALTGASLGE